MRPVRSHMFRGKRYRVEWKSFPQRKGQPVQYGDCTSPAETDRTMRIDTRHGDNETLDTCIHEGLHACLPDLDEEAVTESATSIAKFLWRLGYRRPEAA